MTLNSPLTVVSLMNGMIGGVILVLPVSSYEAGYLFTSIAIIFSCAFSFYSCFLSIKHLGDQSDMNYAMQAHFGNYRIAKILYDIVVWLGLLLGSMFYYGLICLQWQSILGSQSIAIPLLNTLLLFCLIFILKYFDFGATLMGYGIVSIFLYMIFLIWVLASSPHTTTQWKPIGSNLYTFGATMSLAFAIQAFFIPVLMKNPSKEKHVFLTFLAYVIGACVYFYISFMGSFGIMSRKPVKINPETIQDYFITRNIEVRLIECIYLIHLYSCLPEFVLISKKRLFNAFKILQSKKGKIPLKQMLYSCVFLGICLLIRLVGVKIDTIIAINGAIIGFFNIYFFPAILHLKCLYFSKNKIPMSQSITQNSLTERQQQKNVNLQLRETKTLQFKGQMGNSSLKDPWLNDYPQFSSGDESVKQTVERQKVQYNLQQSGNKQKDLQQKNQKITQNKSYFVCDCKPQKNILMKYLEILLVLVMIAVGAAIMVNGLESVV